MTGIKYPKVAVQLSGNDGSAFAIIIRVKRALREADVPEADIKVFAEEAKAGDYADLIQTCMRWVVVK